MFLICMTAHVQYFRVVSTCRKETIVSLTANNITQWLAGAHRNSEVSVTHRTVGCRSLVTNFTHSYQRNSEMKFPKYLFINHLLCYRKTLHCLTCIGVSSFMLVQFLFFFARDSMHMLSAHMLSQFRRSICLSVSHTGGSVKNS